MSQITLDKLALTNDQLDIRHDTLFCTALSYHLAVNLCVKPRSRLQISMETRMMFEVPNVGLVWEHGLLNVSERSGKACESERHAQPGVCEAEARPRRGHLIHRVSLT